MNQQSDPTRCPRCGSQPLADEVFCGCGYQLLNVSTELDRVLESVTLGPETGTARAEPHDSSSSTLPLSESDYPRLYFEAASTFVVHQHSRLRFRLLGLADSPCKAILTLTLEGEGTSLRVLADQWPVQGQIDVPRGVIHLGVTFKAMEQGTFAIRSLTVRLEPIGTESEQAVVYTLADQSLDFVVADPQLDGPNIQNIQVNTGGDLIGSDVKIAVPDRSAPKARWDIVPLIKLQTNLQLGPSDGLNLIDERHPSPGIQNQKQSDGLIKDPHVPGAVSGLLLGMMTSVQGEGDPFVTKMWASHWGSDEHDAGPLTEHDAQGSNFTIGERFLLHLYTDEPCYFTLLNVGTSGAITLICQGKGLPAGRTIQMSGVDTQHPWRFEGPAGCERLIAWFTSRKVIPFPDIRAVQRICLPGHSDEAIGPIQSAVARVRQSGPGEWSTAYCNINICNNLK